MKIIYNCYGGSHSSVTSAAIHLGLLQCGNTPCAGELWKIPYYDTQVKKDHGTLRLMGTDEMNHQIYVAGRRNMGKPVQRALSNLARVYAIPESDFKLVDPMPYVNWAMKIGGITSRRLGLIPVGRPIVTWGTRTAFPALVSLVQKVKQNLKPAEPFKYKPTGVKAVIYCDYTGRQQAAVAAAIHLNKNWQRLNPPKVPLGTLIHWGEDYQGYKVFSMGVSYENELMPKIMREFTNLYDIPQQDLILVDLVGVGKYAYGLGAFLESLSLTQWTQRLWQPWFTTYRLHEISNIVAKTKSQLAQAPAESLAAVNWKSQSKTGHPNP